MNLHAVPPLQQEAAVCPPPGEIRQQLRQQILGGHGGGAHCEHGRRRLRQTALQAPAAIQDLLGRTVSPPSRLGQLNLLFGLPVKQRDPQSRLQTPDMGADRGLAQIQSLRRLGKAVVLCRGHKDLQLLQAQLQHGRHLLKKRFPPRYSAGQSTGPPGERPAGAMRRVSRTRIRNGAGFT